MNEIGKVFLMVGGMGIACNGKRKLHDLFQPKLPKAEKESMGKAGKAGRCGGVG